MSVTETRRTSIVGAARLRRAPARLISLWFFFFSLVFSALAAPLQPKEQIRQSLVRIYLEQDFPGVMLDNLFIPDVSIREVAELEGALMEPGDCIVSYVGNRWRGFHLPGLEVEISVETCDGQRYPARLIGVDERIALIVLESPIAGQPGLPLASSFKQSDIRTLYFADGDWQYVAPFVVGLEKTPLLPEQELQVVSRKPARENSAAEGGLLLDGEGRLLGIVTQTRAHPFSRKLAVWQVLPSDVVRASVDRILAEGKNIAGGWLGVMLGGRSGEIRVNQVVPGGPAERAGLQREDVIVDVDGRRLGNAHELARVIRWKGAGGPIDLSVIRKGRPQRVSAILGERRENGPSISWRLEIPEFWEGKERVQDRLRIYRTVLPPHLNFGWAVEPLTAQLARYFRCPKDQGLLIKFVLQNSSAARAGFRAGDVVLSVNGREVSSYPDLEGRLKKAAEEGPLQIQFLRDGQVQTTRVVLH